MSSVVEQANLVSWSLSGEAALWVQRHPSGWSHQDWLDLLAQLRKSRFWPMDEADIGKTIEALRGKSIVNTTTLLATSLNEDVFRVGLRLNLYSTNMCRLLGCPAGLPDDDFALKYNSFIARLPVQNRAPKGALRTGIEAFVDESSPIQSLRNAPPSPERRLVDELFWPHVNGQVLDAMRDDDWVADAPQLTTPLLQDRRQDYEGAKARHAAAVLLHSSAIFNQVQVLNGQGQFDADMWSDARDAWKRTLADDLFWDYLASRAREMGASLVNASKLAELRRRMPTVIQAFQLAFARGCIERFGARDSCAKQLNLYVDGRLPVVITKGLHDLAEAWVEHRLGPAQAALKAKQGDAPLSEYGNVKTAVADLLAEARQCSDLLRADKQFGTLLASASAMDRFAKDMITTVETINLKSDDAKRILLLRAVAMKAMAGLPISPDTARSIERVRREAVRALYSSALDENEDAGEYDPTACHFCDATEADPDTSILVPMNKVTKLTCAQFGWREIEVLVPRSKVAAAQHTGSKQQSLTAQQAIAHFPHLQSEWTKVTTERHNTLADLDRTEQQALAPLTAVRDAAVADLDRRDRDKRQATASAIRAADEEIASLTPRIAKLKELCGGRGEATRAVWAERLRTATTAHHRSCRRHTVVALVIPIIIAVVAAVIVTRPSTASSASAWAESVSTLANFRHWLADSGVSHDAWLVLVFGLGCGLLAAPVGFMATWPTRKTTARALAACIKSCDAEIKAETDKLEHEVRPLSDALARVTKARDAAQEEAEALDAERRQVLDPHQGAIDAQKRKFDTDRQKCLDRTSGLLSKLEATAMAKLGVRKESTKAEHPMIRKLVKKGFEFGKTPDKEACQRKMSVRMRSLIESLSPETVRFLGMLQEKLPDNISSDVLERVEALPSHRRDFDAVSRILKEVTGIG